MKPIALLALLTSCIHTLPSPQAPAERVPSLAQPKTAPQEGYGRAYLDVPEGSTNVDLFVGTGRTHGAFPLFVGGMVMTVPYSESVDEFRRLCITPCVLDLPVGAHELKFTMRDDANRTDRTVVTFGAPATYLHAVGRDQPNKGPLIASAFVFSLGFANVLVSPIVFAAGETKVGTVMLLGGGAVTAVGSALLWLSRRIKQPGAGARFAWH
ncbi:MAG: hypothetical protein ABI867_29845 [Kofleriaceae bacterium]